MNNDLISREALKETIDDITWYHINPHGELTEGAFDDDDAFYKAEDIFKAIDNAQAVEDGLQGIRPKGYWNEIQAGMLVCPFCGARPHKDFKNFCAKCGANMRKGGAE